MGEDIEKLFNDEVRDKRMAASGVHKKMGKRGRVGKMVTPANLLGRDYTKPLNTTTFTIADVIKKLNEAPGLRAVLLSRMDEEYRNYRMAIERTLDATADALRSTFEPLAEEVRNLVERVDLLCQWLATGEVPPAAEEAGEPARATRASGVPEMTGATGEQRGGGAAGEAEEPLTGGGTDAAARVTRPGRRGRPATRLAFELPRQRLGFRRGGPVAKKKRVRWGNTPEQIRQTVLSCLADLIGGEDEITIRLLRTKLPSALRWIYGGSAVFDGLDGLRDAYRNQGDGQGDGRRGVAVCVTASTPGTPAGATATGPGTSPATPVTP